MQAEVLINPTVEPISLDLAYDHLAIDTDDSSGSPFDAWLETFGIPAARDAAEQFACRSFAPKTYRLRLDEFPDGDIHLPMPPVTKIVSLSYVDEDGVSQTMDSSDYVLDDRQSDSWLAPAYGTSWPATIASSNVVTIEYEAGFTRDNLPPSALWAMLLLLGQAFRFRENSSEKSITQIPMAARVLLTPLRVEMVIS